MADGVAAVLEPPIVVLDRYGVVLNPARLDHAFGWIGEEAGDIVMENGSIGLQRQQIIVAAPHNGFGDGCLRDHGFDNGRRW